MAASRQKVRVQLSPPENIYFSKILSSIGKDPLVQVEPLRQITNNSFLITIHVRGNRKARAMATLIVVNKQIGNNRIHIQVKNSQGKSIAPIHRSLTAREIAELYRIAFHTNTFFKFAVVRSLPFTSVFPVYKACVIQFFADNLADLYRNINEVAASVFKDVLRNKVGRIPINFSTALKK